MLNKSAEHRLVRRYYSKHCFMALDCYGLYQRAKELQSADESLFGVADFVKAVGRRYPEVLLNSISIDHTLLNISLQRVRMEAKTCQGNRHMACSGDIDLVALWQLTVKCGVLRFYFRTVNNDTRDSLMLLRQTLLRLGYPVEIEILDGEAPVIPNVSWPDDLWILSFNETWVKRPITRLLMVNDLLSERRIITALIGIGTDIVSDAVSRTLNITSGLQLTTDVTDTLSDGLPPLVWSIIFCQLKLLR